MKTININEFKNLREYSYTLIHVLPQEHYQNSHISGAINICVYEVSFFDKIKELNLDYDAKIVLYGDCDYELDAKVAASKLHDLGFDNTYILEGGLSENIDSLDLAGDHKQLNPEQLLILENKTYNIVDNSTLTWTGSNANGKHYGTISLKSGQLQVKESKLYGEFIIDMNSIKTLDLSSEEGADYLDAHLKSDDFFLSKIFPEAKYSFENIQSVEIPYQTDINYIINGHLTIKDITKKQDINTLVSKVEDKLILSARVEIDKTKWGMIYGSTKFFKYLGMHKIFDTFQIEIRIELI